MPAITFPTSAFRTAVRDYSREQFDRGADAVVWRELLQNARDAGASAVTASLAQTETQNVLTFRDDGRGMTREVLEKGMLTYSGSVKPSSAAGGFGMAKCLLVFAPDACEIRTLDNAVRVTGINYEWLPVTSPMSGTEFTLYCPREEQPDLRVEPTAGGLKYLLARCNMRGMRVTLNGESIPDCPLALSDDNRVREFPDWQSSIHYFKDVPCFKSADGRNVAIVRHRGIWVMDLTIPSDVNGAIIIETDAPAIKVLNASRCSLANWSHREQVGEFINSLSRAAKSVLKTKRFVRRYDGRTGLTILRSAEAAVAAVKEGVRAATPTGPAVLGTLSIDNVQKFMELVKDAMPAGVERIQGPAALVDVSRAGPDASSLTASESAAVVAQLAWEPALMLINETEKDIPARFFPEGMDKRPKQLLTVWLEMVRQFLIWRRRFVAFGVGFIFDADCEAAYKQESDGSHWFLINPVDRAWKQRIHLSSEESRANLIVSAAHEVAHCLAPGAGHSDEWAVAYDSNMEWAMRESVTLNRIWKTCR